MLQLYRNILSIIHAMTKSFALLCSAQDGESTDMKMANFDEMPSLLITPFHNKGIFPILGVFFEILISLECAVDSE